MTAGQAKARNAHVWKRHKHEWYVEEQWCSARFLEMIELPSPLLDPSCGIGRVVFAARAAGIEARGSDLVPRWRNAPRYRTTFENIFSVADFLAADWPPRDGTWSSPATIMCNPPFRRVRAFYEAAIARARRVIFYLPLTWLAGATTSAWLETTPLATVYPLGPRPAAPPGEYLLDGNKAEGARADVAWFEWQRGRRPVARGGRRAEIYAIRREGSAA